MAIRSPYCGEAKQAIDQPLVGGRRVVGGEGVGFFRRRRQTGQVEAQAAEERARDRRRATASGPAAT